MYYHMEIFKKVDIIVTPSTGYYTLSYQVNFYSLLIFFMI